MPHETRLLHDAWYYARVAAGLAHYQLSRKSSNPDPFVQIREQLRLREQRFLRLARSVLEQKDHLYRRLFDAAGCSYADLESDVARHGLRAALRRLLSSGVYITHDEFRGRTELVRSGRHIPCDPGAFDNPHGRGSNPQATSGSTGRRFITSVSNRYLLYREEHETLESRIMDLPNRARIIVGAILPSTWPIRRQVTWSRLGVPLDRWFVAGVADSSSIYRAVTGMLVTQVNALGGTARQPEYLPPNDFTPVAECLARYRAANRPAYVRTMVSMATRIASAARDRALDIRGTVFSVSGEPLTPAKRSMIEDAGAGVYPFYGATEFGTFGFACPRMQGEDRVHLFEDGVMLVPQSAGAESQHGLFVTSLLPWSPRIVINVGVDDSAVIEPGSCDCEYQRLGFTTHAHSIFSYGKVTSQGTTIDARDLAELIETILPARFGGSPGDFQLVEIDAADQGGIVLRVRPKLASADLREIRDFFLDQLGKIPGGSLSQRLWKFSGGLRVVIEEPEATSTGKIHPLRLLGSSARITEPRPR